MITDFQKRKEEIHAKLQIREVDWATEKSIVNDIWADGFRLIVPLYWREVVFHPKYFLTSYLLLVAVSTLICYFVSVWWFGFIIGGILEAILLGACYKWFSDRVEEGITKGGVYPENAEYLKFFVAVLDNEIVGCIGLTDGEELVKTKIPENTDDTDGQSSKSGTKIASVWRLTVTAPYRKYAIGRKLMMYCEEYLEQQNYTKITLLAGNIDSLHFYDRLKYTKTHLAWEKGYHQSWYYALSLPRSGDTLLTKYTSEKKND